MKNKKTSPLKKESLRYAGQSLDDRINDILYKRILFPLSAVLFLSMFTIFEWIDQFLEFPNTALLYTIVTVIFIIYYAFQIRPTIKYLRDLQLGKNGEKVVAESLEELRVVGYKIYNDFVCDSFNIDHVVVGPAGLFTIETKTYRKQIGKNPQISYDGSKVFVDGASYPKDPIRQARGQMYWLQGFIEDSTKIKIKVKPVVIFPGWYINSKKNDAEVWVLNEKSFPIFLQNSPKILSQEQINLISSHIEKYNRNN